MPFGKFKGCAVENLPLEYLEWLADRVDLREPLLGAVEDAINERHGWRGQRQQQQRWPREEAPRATPPPRQASGFGPSLEALEALVQAGHRALALKHHPDRGGDPEQMKKINAAVTWLTDLIATMRRDGLMPAFERIARRA